MARRFARSRDLGALSGWTGAEKVGMAKRSTENNEAYQLWYCWVFGAYRTQIGLKFWRDASLAPSGGK